MPHPDENHVQDPKWKEWAERARDNRIAIEEEELRDRFAIAALSGLVIAKGQQSYPNLIAKEAYEYADAMMRARKAK